jgi:hypothetical protein
MHGDKSCFYGIIIILRQGKMVLGTQRKHLVGSGKTCWQAKGLFSIVKPPVQGIMGYLKSQAEANSSSAASANSAEGAR